MLQHNLVGIGNQLDIYTQNCIKNSEIPSHLNAMRKAAECHRLVRSVLQKQLKPGIAFREISKIVNDETIKYFGEDSINCGIGFPLGINVNHIAAHDSANPGDNRTIMQDDIFSIDIGIHNNGYIIDSAFTTAFDKKYLPLINSTKEATWKAIKLAGPDVRLLELSQVIQETIESFEIDINNKSHAIHAVRNLGGHNIEQYKIHAGKIILSVPDVKSQEGQKMKEGEVYAIETFATSGNTGLLKLDFDAPCNHFMKKFDAPRSDLKLNITKKLLYSINGEKQTLPFSAEWAFNKVGNSFKIATNDLYKKGIIEIFPPIVDKIGTFTSQLEHTIYIHNKGTEILSLGTDY